MQASQGHLPTLLYPDGEYVTPIHVNSAGLEHKVAQSVVVLLGIVIAAVDKKPLQISGQKRVVCGSEIIVVYHRIHWFCLGGVRERGVLSSRFRPISGVYETKLFISKS